MKKLKIINTTGVHIFEGEDYFPEEKLHGRKVTDKKHGHGIILSDHKDQGWRIVIVKYNKALKQMSRQKAPGHSLA